MPRYTDVTCDSRRVVPGALFVAIPGTHDDGARYIAEARAKGAAAVMGACPGCDLRVDDPRAAFAEACAEHFGRPSERLLLCGVTGTNGKTTTAWLLRDMLAQGGPWPSSGRAMTRPPTAPRQTPARSRPTSPRWWAQGAAPP